MLGLDGVPEAGDQVNAAEDDKVAKQVVEHRRQQERKRELSSKQRFSLENLMERNSEGASKELKVVLKADVKGSAEALKASLTKLSTEKVRVNVIAAAVGGITESDVNLAKAGGAIIVGFHVRPAGKSSKHAEQEGVEIRLYDIIYDALDDVKAAMAGLLAPIKREVAMGKLQVRDTFSIPKMGTVAGCMVVGRIQRKSCSRRARLGPDPTRQGRTLRRFRTKHQGSRKASVRCRWSRVQRHPHRDVAETYRSWKRPRPSSVHVAIARLSVLIPHSHSLKEKRAAVRKIKDRVKAKYDIKVAEVDGLDTWQRAVLGFAVVSNDGAYAQQEVERVIRFVEGLGLGQLIADDRDMIQFGGKWAS